VRRLITYGVAGAAGAATAGAALLLGQVQFARRAIPRAQAPPPRAGGRHGGKRGQPLTMVMLGDSSAAGYGVSKPRQTPGVLLATGISRRLGRPVHLHTLAVVGATSRLLRPQVEAALELSFDLAVIVVGGNDITHRTSRATAVWYLAEAVGALRGTGAQVVVGTCPDLGTVVPIRPPLRWLARRWSRQLARAQTVAAVEAGAWTVSLGDLLGPRFAAEPHRMFGVDRFHPSADGYAAAAAAMLPTTLAALGVVDQRVITRDQGVRSLPRAAVEASQHAGTEVSGASVAGRDRGPAGRWAALRTRVAAAIRPTDAEAPDAEAPDREAGPDPGPETTLRQLESR
jgi:lysophospholipase L1-like esterase